MDGVKFAFNDKLLNKKKHLLYIFIHLSAITGWFLK